ncbi:MAG: hypothetical protein PHV30_00440 [Candidatus Margulisbacteria bacterium]|nr:hypothetical protein [Candidatus Margulisiibacteriota bacterium]
MKPFFLFLVLCLGFCFSISTDKYEAYNKTKSDLLILTNKKISLADKIFESKKLLAKLNFASVANNYNSEDNQEHKKSMHVEERRSDLLSQIKNCELEMDNIEKRINLLNQNLRYYLSK